MTDAPRVPRNTAQAAELLEKFAALDGQIAAIEDNRTASIAAVNADCDRAANGLLEQRNAIVAKLAPWWDRNAAKLTDGKRKSIELGGCEVGSVKARDTLAIAGEPKKLAEALLKTRWGKALVRISPAPDRAALTRSLSGPRAKELAEMGVSIKEGEETFFVKRVSQEGTLAGDGR